MTLSQMRVVLVSAMKQWYAIMRKSGAEVKSDAPVVVPFLAAGVVSDEQGATGGHRVR